MYDLNASSTNPVINYEGISKNFTAVGFQEDGMWMFTAGEDSTAKIWDPRYTSSIANSYNVFDIFHIGINNC